MKIWLSAALTLLAVVGLYVGWETFWFLCDDAYIAFRYVSNSQFGWGYTWNPPPFRPVEGYTSFLWVVLLDAVWTQYGTLPPDSANRLSLAFSYGTLALTIGFVLRMRLSEGLERWRPAILGLVLFGTLTNRTFLAWTSSGLETGMFSALFLLWVFLVTCASGGALYLALVSTVASLVALARPDGLLLVAATGAVGAWRIGRALFETRRIWPHVASLLPLGITGAHLVWRHETYGYWLPNTYYAKHVGVWPLAGVMYIASFLLEYAFWVWLAVAVYAARRAWIALRRDGLRAAIGDEGLDDATVFRIIGAGTVVFQFLYYTISVGGDHFEYRIYHHLVPLALVTLPWLTDRLHFSPRKTLAVLAAMVVLGLPVPWIHWWHTHGLERREQTFMLRYKVAPHLPLPVRWYGHAFDALQHWLISHYVGSRHQGHKNFCTFQFERFPSREEGLKIDATDFPVLEHVSVGVPGWVLPKVAIIDKLGLNDAIIARAEPAHASQIDRVMAHDRKPPKGYVSCFKPNVKADDKGELMWKPRKSPLTAADIVACEEKFMAQVLAEQH